MAQQGFFYLARLKSCIEAKKVAQRGLHGC